MALHCGTATHVSGKGASGFLYGLGGAHPWQQARFIDWVNVASVRRPTGYLYYSKDHPELLGANGLPAALPSGDTQYLLLLREGGDEEFGSMSGGVTIEFSGCTVEVAVGGQIINTSTPGVITLDYVESSDARLHLRVTPTEFPHTIHAYQTKFAAEFAAGDVFDPDWLASVDHAAGWRFMDWQETNGSEATSMADIYVDHRLCFGNHTVPLETCAMLANQTNGASWFCIPHLFDDTSVEAFVNAVLDLVTAGKTIFFEFSNELWNTEFAQTNWAKAQALAEWGNNTQLYYMSWYAKRSTEVMTIVKATAATRGRSRDVRTVLGLKTDTASHAQYAIDATQWQTEDPTNYKHPSTVHDFAAITGYFGSGPDIFQGAGAQAIIDDLETNGAASAATLLLDAVEPTVASKIEWMRARCTAIVAAGMRPIIYEANQHCDLNSQRYSYYNSPFWQSTLDMDGDETAYVVGETVTHNTGDTFKVIAKEPGVLTVRTGRAMVAGDTIIGSTSGQNQTVAATISVAGSTSPGVDDMMKVALWSQRMSDFQETIRDAWIDMGGTYWCQFVDYARYDKRGNWGTGRYRLHVNPVRTDLETWAAANPRGFLLGAN